jgi:hypothetical protein
MRRPSPTRSFSLTERDATSHRERETTEKERLEREPERYNRERYNRERSNRERYDRERHNILSHTERYSTTPGFHAGGAAAFCPPRVHAGTPWTLAREESASG